MGKKNGKSGHLTSLAEFLGITKQSAQWKCRRAGLDTNHPDGIHRNGIPLTYEEVKVILRRGENRAYDRKMERTDTAGELDNAESFSEYQRLDQKWKAARNELKYRQEASQLIDLGFLRESLTNLCVTARTILLSVPSQIGREIDNPVDRRRAVAIAERCVREALGALANYDPLSERGDGEGEDPDEVKSPISVASAEANGEPVGRAKTVSQQRRRRNRKVEE